MPLVTTKELLLKAQKSHYAVGAFNGEADRFLTVLPHQTITSAELSYNYRKVTENEKKYTT